MKRKQKTNKKMKENGSTYSFPMIISFQNNNNNNRSMTALMIDSQHMSFISYINIINFIINKSISVVVCLRVHSAMQWS